VDALCGLLRVYAVPADISLPDRQASPTYRARRSAAHTAAADGQQQPQTIHQHLSAGHRLVRAGLHAAHGVPRLSRQLLRRSMEDAGLRQLAADLYRYGGAGVNRRAGDHGQHHDHQKQQGGADDQPPDHYDRHDTDRREHTAV